MWAKSQEPATTPPLSEEKLHMISVLGAGLLVGVAFAVIIPEGVLTLIKAYTLKSHHNLHQRATIDTGTYRIFVLMYYLKGYVRLVPQGWPLSAWVPAC